MQQGCHFCTQNLKSVEDIIRHYNDVHGFNKDNSPTFESYIDVISKDPTKLFVEHYKYCTEPPLFDLNFKAEHLFMQAFEAFIRRQRKFVDQENQQ